MRRTLTYYYELIGALIGLFLPGIFYAFIKNGLFPESQLIVRKTDFNYNSLYIYIYIYNYVKS